jgi:hypothetical protein
MAAGSPLKVGTVLRTAPPRAPDLRLGASRAIAYSAPRVNFRCTFSYVERGCRILDHSAATPCMIRWRSNASFVRSVVSAMPAWPEALPAPFIVRASVRKRWFSTRFLMEGSNLRLRSNGIIQGRPIVSASGANFFHWKGGMTLASPSAPSFGCRADARPARGGCPSRGLGQGHYSTIARGTGAVHPAHPECTIKDLVSRALNEL